jgi:hypothetical protein
MATVESMQLDRLLDLEAATVIGGHIDGSGHLILEHHDGSTTDAGYALVAVPDATATIKGVVELATPTEATAGTDTTRAVTPEGLAAAVGSLVPSATTSLQGKVELATTAETTTGTDTVRAVTPAGVKAAIDAAMQLIFPVGSIYMSYSVSTNPATLLGFGTWTAIQDKVLIGAGGAYAAGATGGAASVTLTTTELPAHTHAVGTLATSSGGGHTHSIGRDKTGATGSVEYINHSTGTSGAGQIYSGQLTTDGAHTHPVTGSTASAGTGSAFSILPPYTAVYIWRRSA